MSKDTLPLVSVIINCYNSEAYLKDAVDSVYCQSYGNWEIILWDNASIDNTAAIAQSYDSRLKYFCGEKNVPLGMARNLAIQKSQGDLIAILDSDDVWFPDKLEKQVLHFQNPKVGLSYANTVYFNNKGKSFILYKKQMPEGDIFRNLLQFYFLCISSVVVRKTALDNLQECFDNRFEMIEEMDLFCRVAHDWHCAYCADVITKYRVHGLSDTWKKFDKIAFEYQFFLEKCIRTYPGFEKNFLLEILRLKKITLYYHIVSKLLSGDSVGLRKNIKFRYFDTRFLLLYIASFLPRSIFRYLYSKRRFLI
ncbi:MAG: glycosyltransferase family 2 protein [Chlorobium sp.]